MDGLKITVESLQNLPDGASCNPYVRIRMGDLVGETYTGVRSFESNSSFEFKNTMIFPERSLMEPLNIEIVNCDDMKILFDAVITDWRPKFDGRKSVAFLVSLPHGGHAILRLLLRLMASSDKGRKKIPDRLDVMVASIGGVNDKINVVRLKGRLTDFDGNIVYDEFEMEQASAGHGARGNFEFNALKTIAFKCQPLLVVDAINGETSQRLGTARYHLLELLEVKDPKSKFMTSGRLLLADDMGNQVAFIKIGFKLWDTTKYNEQLEQQRAHLAQLKEQVRAADELQKMCEDGRERVPYMEKSLETSSGVLAKLHEEIPEVERELSGGPIRGRADIAEMNKRVRNDIAVIQGDLEKACQSLNFSAHQFGKCILKDGAEIQTRSNTMLQDSRVAPAYSEIGSPGGGGYSPTASPGSFSPGGGASPVRGPDGEVLNQEVLYREIKESCDSINEIYEQMSNILVQLSAGGSSTAAPVEILNQMNAKYEQLANLIKTIEARYASLSLIYKKYRHNSRQYNRYMGTAGSPTADLSASRPPFGTRHNPLLTCCMGI